MSILIIILLFSISLIFIILKFRKTGVILFVATVAGCLYIGSGLFPLILLENLQQPFKNSFALNDWSKNNSIVMLGAGNTTIPSTTMVKPTLFSYGRIYKTAALYFSCKQTNNQCKIILSGGDPLNTGKSESQASREELLNLGVHSEDIIMEPKSVNTFKNAEFTSAILKSHVFDRIVLVTSGIHMKRSLLYFSNFGIYPKPVISDYVPPNISPVPLAYNFALTDLALHEYIGILRFHFYNYMKWNSRSIKGDQVKIKLIAISRVRLCWVC